ncbi:MAG: PCRF domain-containing protein, partial [Lachnospiraceae bacterium]|nr:PCRF domain-containing protein [Lachnospiraceae bacterium]
MVELDQIKQELAAYEEPLREVKASLALEQKKQRVEELEREMEAPGFWDDAERAQKMTIELKSYQDVIQTVEGLEQQKADML